MPLWLLSRCLLFCRAPLPAALLGAVVAVWVWGSEGGASRHGRRDIMAPPAPRPRKRRKAMPAAADAGLVSLRVLPPLLRARGAGGVGVCLPKHASCAFPSSGILLGLWLYSVHSSAAFGSAASGAVPITALPPRTMPRSSGSTASYRLGEPGPIHSATAITATSSTIAPPMKTTASRPSGEPCLLPLSRSRLSSRSRQ